MVASHPPTHHPPPCSFALLALERAPSGCFSAVRRRRRHDPGHVSGGVHDRMGPARVSASAEAKRIWPGEAAVLLHWAEYARCGYHTSTSYGQSLSSSFVRVLPPPTRCGVVVVVARGSVRSFRAPSFFGLHRSLLPTFSCLFERVNTKVHTYVPTLPRVLVVCLCGRCFAVVYTLSRLPGPTRRCNHPLQPMYTLFLAGENWRRYRNGVETTSRLMVHPRDMQMGPCTRGLV